MKNPHWLVWLSPLALVLSGLAEAADKPNILLLCIDDLRPELHCYGVDYIYSPNIDQLASQSRIFNRHYVQAPTCGASRFTLLTGRYGGASNNALFDRAQQLLGNSENSVPASMPSWFRQHGYRTVSVGKVSHHPGGRGGPDWNDDSKPEMPHSWDRHLLKAGPWQHPRGAMHGLANGEIRDSATEMDLFQSTPGGDEIYPDGLTTEAGLQQLDELSRDATKPFFLAVGIIRPHLPFGAPAKYYKHYQDVSLPVTPHPMKPQGRTTWHGSGEFMKYNRWGKNPNTDPEFAVEVRKHYAACVSYADAQVGRLLERLNQLGLHENTIVVLWGDHGWHLGEHAIWGKHALFEESLRSPLLMRTPNVEKPGIATDAIVESLDVFPTLCELADLPSPDFVDGVSLTELLKSPNSAGHSAVSYTGRAQTIRTKTHRLIKHRDGFVELYRHVDANGSTIPDAETRNLAQDSPEMVAALTLELENRLSRATQLRP